MRSFFILLLICSALSAGTPDWVKNQGKSKAYPDALYLTGYGIAAVVSAGDTEPAKEAAVSNARKNLIEKIRVNIQSTVAAKTEETGEKFSSIFSSATQSTSNLEIQGLETETFFEDDMMYAFVFVKRENIVSLYSSKVGSLKKEIEAKVRLAKTLEQQNKSTQALNEYLSGYPLCRQLEEAQSVLAFVKISNSLNDLTQSAAANEITIGQIREAVVKLVLRPINTVDDLAWFLVYQLKEQAEKNGSGKLQVTVTPLIYQDTKMGSSFSRYFNQVLEQKLPEVAQWDAVQQSAASYLLTGSYWEQNNTVKFIVNVRSIKEGRIIASAEATVPSSVPSATEKSLKPENYKSALIDQKIFAAGETVGGGLIVEGWTNKEAQGNLFSDGEKMNVIVRVNMPCYIRLIYHMADGKRVLLYNEYFLDASKVNVAYEIPQEFECSGPFGSEVLQIFARTDKFNSVNVQRVNGYDYLQEDLKSFIVQTRGMKAVKPATMQSETRINITTMKE
ncbi:MAG: DUF4384 domain-containing protein [Bacteroidota bacterium]